MEVKNVTVKMNNKMEKQKTFEFSKINEGWGIAFVLNFQYFMLELIWFQFVINFKYE